MFLRIYKLIGDRAITVKQIDVGHMTPKQALRLLEATRGGLPPDHGAGLTDKSVRNVRASNPD